MFREEVDMRLYNVKLGLLFAGCLGITSSMAGCDGLFVDCKTAGCVDNLIVHLYGALPPSYNVIARAPGHEPKVFECNPARMCRDQAFFELVASRVELEVVAEGVSVRKEVRPEYRPFRPNGPRCPPVCQHAEVSITI
jgi:hypothetical protein